MNRNYYLDDIYVSESLLEELQEYEEVNFFISENRIRNYDSTQIIDLSSLPSNVKHLSLNISGKVNMIPISINSMHIHFYGEELIIPENVKELWFSKDYLIIYPASYKSLPEHIEQINLTFTQCIDLVIDLDCLPKNIKSIYITTLYNNDNLKINISKKYSKLKRLQLHEIHGIDLTEIKKYCDENKVTFINSYYEIVGC
jgi:hypothetical protein